MLITKMQVQLYAYNMYLSKIVNCNFADHCLWICVVLLSKVVFGSSYLINQFKNVIDV